MASVDPTVVALINSSLDRERKECALPNDNELARHLGISSKTLSFWRNGRLSRTDSVLAKIVAAAPPRTLESPPA